MVSAWGFRDQLPPGVAASEIALIRENMDDQTILDVQPMPDGSSLVSVECPSPGSRAMLLLSLDHHYMSFER